MTTNGEGYQIMSTVPTSPPGALGASASGHAPVADGHGWRAVSIVLAGAFMALLDTTIVTVALPTIRTGLHASPATLVWVVSGYALASILWQSGLARSALMTGLIAVPFSFGSLVSAANSDKLSAAMGRMVLVTGCAMAGIGLALSALVIHLTAPDSSGWDLAGPLLLAGLGSGIVIAPNQDFVLARVPSQEAGTANTILGAAQWTGSAIGVAVIGTVLYGNLHLRPGPNAVASAFSHSSQLALLANAAMLVLALILVLALPRQIPSRKP